MNAICFGALTVALALSLANAAAAVDDDSAAPVVVDSVGDSVDDSVDDSVGDSVDDSVDAVNAVPSDGAVAAGAAGPPEFADAGRAARYRRVIAELRCLVCQNQNLADSNAGLARDMRAAAARMIRAGASERAVMEFMTARYGDFVLYRPPFRPATWLLWLGPGLLVGLGLAAVAAAVRRPRRAELGAEERRRAAALLEDE